MVKPYMANDDVVPKINRIEQERIAFYDRAVILIQAGIARRLVVPQKAMFLLCFQLTLVK